MTEDNSLGKINRSLKKNDIQSTLSDCIDEGYFTLGLFLAKVTKNDKMYKDLVDKPCKVNTVSETDLSVLKEKAMKIKEKENKVKTVKLLCNWCSSKDLCTFWNKMSKGDYTWGNIKIVSTEKADYYVIINAVSTVGDTYYDPKKTIVFQMEPNMALDRRWNVWSKPSPKDFLRVLLHENGDYNNIEWHLSKSYSELKSMKITKTQLISTVLSEKYIDSGHVQRVDFVKFLEDKGFDIHVYGSNRWNYKNYMGELPYGCKDLGIFPYKYTFNVENQSLLNYFTEKLVDGILGECLVFYSGCYNVREYIDEKAYVYLEMYNFEKALETIQTAIKEDWHSQRLPYIRQAKEKILDELQFFPRLDKLVENL